MGSFFKRGFLLIILGSALSAGILLLTNSTLKSSKPRKHKKLYIDREESTANNTKTVLDLLEKISEEESRRGIMRGVFGQCKFKN